MITMVDKNSILLKYYRDFQSIRSISRELKLSRNTVRKYLAEHSGLLSPDDLPTRLESGISTTVKYNISPRSKRRLTVEIEAEINSCLLKNKEKLSIGFGKQIMKKRDILEHLHSLGFQIGYTTVCNYIRNFESRGKESFIKQTYQAGDVCEFDWGDVKLHIGDKVQVFNLAVFTSAYGNYRWAKLFYRQDTLAFSQSHIDFFSHTQGVYKELVYDNMRVAVSKFTGRSEKTPTVALLELSNYYKFGFRFCNIRKGNEKGHVERSVEYVRRKAFCVQDEFDNIDEANRHLFKKLDKINATGQTLKGGRTAHELFQIERPNLYPTSQPYKCFKEEYAKVDKYSTIILYGNRYSVLDFLVGKLINIRVFAERIDLYFNSEKICTHIRSYGAHTWTIDIAHYLTTFSRKPGALKNSLALENLHQSVSDIFHTYFINDSKGFIELLQYCHQHEIEFESIKIATDKLLTISPLDINKDKILAIIAKAQQSEEQATDDSQIAQYAQASLEQLSQFFKLN